MNIFALGYIYRTTALVKAGAPFIYPEWERWKDLFLDGLKLFLLGIVWVGVPMIIGKFVWMILAAISFYGMFDEVGRVAFMASIPIGIQLFGEEPNVVGKSASILIT